jgi:hypothetical protein
VESVGRLALPGPSSAAFSLTQQYDEAGRRSARRSCAIRSPCTWSARPLPYGPSAGSVAIAASSAGSIQAPSATRRWHGAFFFKKIRLKEPPLCGQTAT